MVYAEVRKVAARRHAGRGMSSELSTCATRVKPRIDIVSALGFRSSGFTTLQRAFRFGELAQVARNRKEHW